MDCSNIHQVGKGNKKAKAEAKAKEKSILDLCPIIPRYRVPKFSSLRFEKLGKWARDTLLKSVISVIPDFIERSSKMGDAQRG